MTYSSQQKIARAFVGLWWTLGVVLFVLSVETAAHAAPHGHGHAHLHTALLGSLEAVAALLFLIPRTMRIGGVGLLLIFAAAFVLHATRGEFPGQLLIYAAGVVFCLVHGPIAPMRSFVPAGE